MRPTDRLRELAELADNVPACPYRTEYLLLEAADAVRLDFRSTNDLIAFFLGLIGNPIMDGMSSKAIGTTLLIWHR